MRYHSLLSGHIDGRERGCGVEKVSCANSVSPTPSNVRDRKDFACASLGLPHFFLEHDSKRTVGVALSSVLGSTQ